MPCGLAVNLGFDAVSTSSLLIVDCLFHGPTLEAGVCVRGCGNRLKIRQYGCYSSPLKGFDSML